MLTLYHNGQELPIQNTEYYVRELVSGLDEVSFYLSIYDPVYAVLQEEEQIVDRGGQRYLVKQIDAGANEATVIAQLDLDDWKSAMYIGYNSGSKRVAAQIEAVKPAGWSVLDMSGSTISRTITGDYTALEIAQQCCSIYKVYIRWDNKTKTVTIRPQAMSAPVGSFATRELNLIEINYKGKSIDFATRIYPYGKDGLSIQGATIDGKVYDKAYIDNNTYSDRIISVVWKDERYEVAQNLYDDAVERLAELAVPSRSYECSIVDLQATDPEKYGNLDFSLFTTATLIDDIKNVAVNYMVVERHVYPYHPDQNVVVLDHSPQKITTRILQISTEIEEQETEFISIMETEIERATQWLTDADSHIYIKRNPQTGEWQELYFLDGTQDPESATRIMRLNSSGLGFSKSGINGPFTNAFVFDDVFGGHLIADFITAGVLTANIIKAGILRALTGDNYWNLETGEFQLQPTVKVGNSTIASIADTEAAEQAAQEYADDAVDTLRQVVNKKVTTYYQPGQPAVASSVTGDLWIDTDDGNSLHRFNGTAWVDVDNADIAKALMEAADAQSTADSKIVTYAQPGQPTGATVGDLWIDTDDNNKLYRWNGTTWVDSRDGSITEAEQAAKNYADGLVEDLTKVVDGKITTYYQAAQPAVADSVTGDLWIDTDDGNSLHRFNGTAWVDVDNADIQQALNDAADAQSTADSKIVTFAQTAQPAASVSSVGDLWIDTDDNNKLYRFNGTNWVAYRDGAIAISEQAAKNFAQGLVDDLTEVVDGKITTYYQSGQPSNPNTGDLWIDTDDGNSLHRWDGTTWTDVDNTDISKALQDAADAQSTADSKIVTFAQTAQPAASVSSVGDLWIDTDDNNKLYRYNGTTWVAYRDGTIALSEQTAKSYADGLVEDLTKVVDGKITTYYQGGAPTSPNAGDLWINTTNNKNTLHRYNGTQWVDVDNTDIAKAITDAQAAYDLADGKIVTYAQPTQPASAQLGDMWINTTNNANTLYRYNGTQWVAYHDAEIAAAEASAKSYTDAALSNYDQNVLNQQAVFNKLTDNGDITGIYMENGQLYVNATYIKSGTLTLGGANNQNGTMIVYDASGNEIGHWTNAGIYVKNGEIYQEQFVDESVGTAWLRIQSTEITGGYTALNHTALIDLQDWQWVTDTSTGEQVKEGVLNLKCQNGSVAITPDDGFYAQAPKEISIASGTGASMTYMDLSAGTIYNAVAVAAQGVAIVGNSTPIILSSSSGINLNGAIRTNGYTGMTNTRIGWRHDNDGILQYCSIVNGLLINAGFY